MSRPTACILTRGALRLPLVMGVESVKQYNAKFQVIGMSMYSYVTTPVTVCSGVGRWVLLRSGAT